MKLTELKGLLKKRNKKGEEIRSKANFYMEKEYGISCFFEHVDSILGQPKPLDICIGRQIPTVFIESCAFEILVDLFNFYGLRCNSKTFTLGRDGYGNHDYKKRLIELKLSFGRKGNTIKTKKYRIIDSVFTRSKIDNMVLERIPVKQNVFPDISADNLLEFHYQLRKKVFKTVGNLGDLGELSELLARSAFSKKKHIPKFIFLSDGEKEKKICSSQVDDINQIKQFRPDAMWYYLPYLMCFVDGRRALLASRDDDRDVLTWFDKNVRMITKVIGVTPIIIEIPYKTRIGQYETKFNEINAKIFENANWKQHIYDRIKTGEGDFELLYTRKDPIPLEQYLDLFSSKYRVKLSKTDIYNVMEYFERMIQCFS